MIPLQELLSFMQSIYVGMKQRNAVKKHVFKFIGDGQETVWNTEVVLDSWLDSFCAPLLSIWSHSKHSTACLDGDVPRHDPFRF